VAYEACFALTAAVVGEGAIAEVTPDASSGCVAGATFAAGEQVTVRAQPAVGFVFAGWTGACTGSAVSCQFAVDGPSAVTASFVRQALPVSAAPAVVGEGSVKVEVLSTPAAVVTSDVAAASTAAPDATYPYGTRLRLTAEPAPSYRFGGWSGSASGSANPLDVTVTTPLEIRAAFVPAGGPELRAYLPFVRR
ncbi:MAG: InlB B-repeat-containing protein, partial [Caldilineaceae bacterium]